MDQNAGFLGVILRGYNSLQLQAFLCWILDVFIEVCALDVMNTLLDICGVLFLFVCMFDSLFVCLFVSFENMKESNIVEIYNFRPLL